MKVKTKIKGRMYETNSGEKYTKYVVYYRRRWPWWRVMRVIRHRYVGKYGWYENCLDIAEWNTREEAEEVANNIEQYI